MQRGGQRKNDSQHEKCAVPFLANFSGCERRKTPARAEAPHCCACGGRLQPATALGPSPAMYHRSNSHQEKTAFREPQHATQSSAHARKGINHLVCRQINSTGRNTAVVHVQEAHSGVGCRELSPTVAPDNHLRNTAFKTTSRNRRRAFRRTRATCDGSFLRFRFLLTGFFFRDIAHTRPARHVPYAYRLKNFEV